MDFTNITAPFSLLRCSNCLKLLVLIHFVLFICIVHTSKRKTYEEERRKDWKFTDLMMQSVSKSIDFVSLNPPKKITTYTRCYLQSKWLNYFRQRISKQCTTQDQFTPLSEGIWCSISYLLKEHSSRFLQVLLLKLQHTAKNYSISQMKWECLYILEFTTCSH